MRKTIFLLAILVLSVFAESYAASSSTIYNYNQFYRGPRSLGMGGAYTAVGRDAEGVFYNPATLYDMNFHIEVLNPLLEYDNNAKDIQSDMTKAMDKSDDTERTSALTDIIRKNAGKPLHARIALFPNVSWKSAVIGAVGQGEIDARLHDPLSSSGAVEMKSIVSYGPIGGFSKQYNDNFRVGLGAKVMSYTTLNENFTIAELSDPDFKATDSQKKGSDFAIDAGGLYSFSKGRLGKHKSQFGVSVLNISDLNYGSLHKIPMTVNLGFSMRPETSIGEIILAADLHDIGFAHNQDKSLFKRLHLGTEFAILNRHLTVLMGLNQGYGTFGARVDFWLIKLSYAYYTEEMGAYAGQDNDARHVIQISLGW